jgi:putative FmdB family regulatory protein
MPLYDYDCLACGRRFEAVHGVHAEGPTRCPICGSGPVRKAITVAAVHFKGTGWAKKERRATATPGASKAAGEGAAADGGTQSGEESSTDGGAMGDDAVAPSGAAAATATKPADTATTSKAD